MKDRRIKRLELALSAAAPPLKATNRDSMNLMVAESNNPLHAPEIQGSLRKCAVIGADRAIALGGVVAGSEEKLLVSSIQSRPDAGRPAKARSGEVTSMHSPSHHAVTSSDADRVTSFVGVPADASSKLEPSASSRSAGKNTSAATIEVTAVGVGEVASSDVVMPPAATAIVGNAANAMRSSLVQPLPAPDSVAWRSFLVNTAPHTVKEVILKKWATETGGMVSCKPPTKGIEYSVEYLTSEDATRAWAIA